jgi:hypothetical protein
MEGMNTSAPLSRLLNWEPKLSKKLSYHLSSKETRNKLYENRQNISFIARRHHVSDILRAGDHRAGNRRQSLPTDGAK